MDDMEPIYAILKLSGERILDLESLASGNWETAVDAIAENRAMAEELRRLKVRVNDAEARARELDTALAAIVAKHSPAGRA